MGQPVLGSLEKFASLTLSLRSKTCLQVAGGTKGFGGGGKGQGLAGVGREAGQKCGCGELGVFKVLPQRSRRGHT